MSEEKKETKTLDLPNKTPEELKQLAKDMAAGMVFTDRHIEKGNSSLGLVFIPIAMGAFASYGADDLKKIGLIYEYVNKAGPRSINGMPCFFSFKMLNWHDTELVFKMVGHLLKTEDPELDRIARGE